MHFECFVLEANFLENGIFISREPLIAQNSLNTHFNQKTNISIVLPLVLPYDHQKWLKKPFLAKNPQNA